MWSLAVIPSDICVPYLNMQFNNITDSHVESTEFVSKQNKTWDIIYNFSECSVFKILGTFSPISCIWNPHYVFHLENPQVQFILNHILFYKFILLPMQCGLQWRVKVICIDFWLYNQSSRSWFYLLKTSWIL